MLSTLTALALTTQIVLLGPGVIRRAAAAHEKGIAALDPINLTHAFATQLQFGHTAGCPDLVFTPSVLGRKQPLEVYGPPGIRTLTEHVLAAWNAGVQVNAHEIAAGLVCKPEACNSSSNFAARARPELLILQSRHPNENELTRRLGEGYRGRFVIGHDLDLY